MRDEVLAALDPRAGGRYIDGTVNGGGHASAILEASVPDGRLLGLDADPRAIERASHNLARFGTSVTLVQANFRTVRRVAVAHDFAPCDGVLFDLGLSSDQLADEDRGCAFQR